MLTIERDRDTMETNVLELVHYVVRPHTMVEQRLHRKALARLSLCSYRHFKAASVAVHRSGAVAVLVENLRLHTNCVADYEEGLGLIRQAATFA